MWGKQRWEKNLCGWSSCALWGHVELGPACGNNHNDKLSPYASCRRVCTLLLFCDDCSHTGDKTSFGKNSFQPFHGFAHPQLVSLLQFSQPLKWVGNVTQLYFEAMITTRQHGYYLCWEAWCCFRACWVGESFRQIEQLYWISICWASTCFFITSCLRWLYVFAVPQPCFRIHPQFASNQTVRKFSVLHRVCNCCCWNATN